MLVVVGFGDMVKSADVIVAPTEVDDVAPVTEVEAPGTGAADAFVVFEMTLLLLLVAAATGCPVTTVLGAPEIICGFGESVIEGAEPWQATTTVWVGPEVVVYVVVGGFAPTVVTILL